MLCQSPLVLEASKDTECMYAFTYTAYKRHINFAQTKHLNALNQTKITARTSAPQGIMRTRDTQIDRNLAGWIIRYRSRIVVMIPEASIVAKFGNLINFIFSFNIAVLGDTNIDTDTAPIHSVDV